MLMEYPQISFEIAKIHARMIQRLLEQIQAEGTHESLMKDFFNKDNLPGSTNMATTSCWGALFLGL